MAKKISPRPSRRNDNFFISAYDRCYHHSTSKPFYPFLKNFKTILEKEFLYMPPILLKSILHYDH